MTADRASPSWQSWSKRVDLWNWKFRRYPRIVYDKGWVYGVWYCGTPWRKATMYGQYPATFRDRAIALFPGARDVLHCPSGALEARLGEVTVDAIGDDGRHPMVVADAEALPFTSSSFDLYLSDPPYTPEDAKVYGTRPYRLQRAMREAWRVLRPNGYFGLLHLFFPPYRARRNLPAWRHEGLIAVVTGFQRRTRIFSIYRCVKGSIDSPDVSHGGGKEP